MKHPNRLSQTKKLDKLMGLDYPLIQLPREVYPLYHPPWVSTFAGSPDIFELKPLKKIKLSPGRAKVHCLWQEYSCNIIGLSWMPRLW